LLANIRIVKPQPVALISALLNRLFTPEVAYTSLTCYTTPLP